MMLHWMRDSRPSVVITTCRDGVMPIIKSNGIQPTVSGTPSARRGIRNSTIVRGLASARAAAANCVRSTRMLMPVSHIVPMAARIAGIRVEFFCGRHRFLRYRPVLIFSKT